MNIYEKWDSVMEGVYMPLKYNRTLLTGSPKHLPLQYVLFDLCMIDNAPIGKHR